VRREGPASGGHHPMNTILRTPPAVPASAAGDLAELTAALRDCSRPYMRPAAQLERATRFLEPVFERLYESPGSRLRDLEQLEKVAASSPSRARFLSDLTLDPPTSTEDLAGPPHRDEDYVILSTIHSAKGGEWDVVHLIHAADGMVPSDMATGNAEQVEEERRLFYVALTRARDSLHVYFPLRYYRRPRGTEDPHAYAQLTRFLPPEVRSTFHEVGTPEEPAADEARTGDPARPVLVDAFLESLWAD
jgi:DNA helicase II / ATP-dependent DNA helicase PcrA